MKTITMIFLSLFLTKDCSQKEKEEMKKATIEYQAISRGSYVNIQIQNETLSIVRARDEKAKSYQLVKEDFKELADLFVKIDLNQLENYKGPAEKRFYDGAAMANVRIVYEGKVYQSQTFDHDSPPVEIEAFVNKIVSFVKTEDNDN
jgi:hypothetical protein